MQVIRSLKRALQPAVTDVAVEFKLSGDQAQWEILQSPQKPPLIFNGEKVVIYGILKSKTTPKEEVSGTAVLRGSMLGKVVEHSVPFMFQPTEFQGLPTVHHLAAKALIKDWQTMGGRDSKEIVRLSVESSVISSHTAFIAVDEESSEPVAGAMKTWDVRTHMAEGNSRAKRRRRKCDSSDQLVGISRLQATCDEIGAMVQSQSEMLECERVAVNSMEECSRSAGKSGGFFSSLSNWMFGSSDSSKSAPQPKVQQPSYEADLLCECMDDTFEIPSLPAQIPTSPAKPGVTAVITKQQADGSWKLDTTLAQLLGKDQKALEDACPVKCEGPLSAVWATVLVLTRLRLGYSDQQEEWELIATKAESWLRRQQLPAGTTLEDLYQAAEKLLA